MVTDLFRYQNLTIVTFVSITVCSKQVVTSNHGHGNACQSKLRCSSHVGFTWLHVLGWQQAKATDSSMSSEGCSVFSNWWKQAQAVSVVYSQLSVAQWQGIDTCFNALHFWTLVWLLCGLASFLCVDSIGNRHISWHDIQLSLCHWCKTAREQ